MNAVGASAGEDAMRGLIETAFTGAEPALPDVDDVMATVETLGGRIRRRQRVRTGLAAGMLCLAASGMVAGIAAVAHSHGGGGSVIMPGGGGQAPAPVTTTLTGLSRNEERGGTGEGMTHVEP